MKQKTFKALLVGGTVTDARLIGQGLALISAPVELARVASVKDALKTLSKGRIDLVLLKLPRSASRAQSLFGAVHAASPATPVIVVAGEGQQETTARLLREGAVSWLPADEIGSRAFVRTVRRTLRLEPAEPPTRGEEAHARTAAALRASEERYSSLVSNLPVGVYRSLPDGRIIEANDAAAEMLGFENAAALQAVNASDLYVEPKDRTVVLDKLSTTRTFFAEFQLNRRDGRTIWVRDFPRAVLNAQGEIEYVDGVLVDVTEKRMAEEALRAAHGELEARVAARTTQLAEANESLRREIAEHQLAVAARRESEERFRALAENSLDVIIRFDREYRHLYVNPPVEAQTGIKPSSFIGRTHRELGFSENLCELWEAAIEQVFSTGREHRIEFELPSHIWLDWQLVPAFAPDGSVAYVMTAARDITDRKLAEAALERSHEELEHRVAERTAELAGANAALQTEIAERKRAAAALQDSEERFRRLSQAAFEGIAISDEGRLVDVNGRFAEMFGYDIADMQRRDIRELVAPEYRDEVWSHILSGYEAAYETVCLRKDGSKFPAEVHARSLPFGSRTLRITAIRDITERRKAEEDLKLKARLLDAAVDTIFVHDLEGNLIYANEAAYRTRGYEREEFMAMNLRSLLSPLDAARFDERMAEIAAKGQGVFESTHIRKDGSHMPVETRPTAVTSGSKTIVMAIVRDITERKRAEEALRESEETTRALLNAPDHIAILTDRKGTILAANERAAALFGIHLDELIGSLATDLFDPAASAARGKRSEEVFRTGRPLRLEEEVSGTHFDVTYYPVFDSQGQVARMAVVARDVTARKRSEQIMLRQAAFMKAAMDGMAILDERGVYAYVNDAHARIYGYENADELLGKTWEDLYDGRELERFQHEIMPAFFRTGRWRGEAVGRKKDDTVFPQEVSLTRIADGGMVCVVRDLTESKRAEEARVRLATAVAQAAETILITDPNGTIQYVNPAFERTTGYGAAEAIGRNPRILKSGEHDGAFYRRMWETLARGEVWSGHLVNRRKDGAHFEEEATISPVRDATGAVVNYVAVKRDVTQEVQLAEQLRESQKLRAIGQLAGGVAHDFNNLLQALLGTVEVLRSRGHDLRVLPRAITELEADVRRGAALTRQLLLFAHRGVVKPESLDVNEVVRDTESLLRRLVRENIRFTCELCAAPLPVKADRGQLEQVLVNLAVNAADAMPDGGTLVIRTSEHGGREVILEVEDSGVGIPDELQPRIFEPFFTTKGTDRGIGLGLSVVHGIVTQHGGRVEVKSRVGAGSTFLVALPLHSSEPVHRAPEPAAMLVMAPHSRGERVLLVEDEPGAREGLRQILSMLGYDVTAAASAEDVVKLPPGQGFDLLLTDLLLPGMHGGELANDMRQKWPGLRVIVMSGYAEDEAVRRGVREGALRFLQKPFDMVTLARELRAALDQK
jgi:two-component system cell cycle sensor histidine kinase/response regulator CckA